MKTKRIELIIEVDEPNQFISKALYFSQSFSHYTYFNNNNIPYLFDAFPHMLMIGCSKNIKATSSDPFYDLKVSHEREADWYSGYWGYDLKNSIEDLSSNNTDRLGFPDFYFYCPEHIIIFESTSLKIISYHDPMDLFEKINSYKIKKDSQIVSRAEFEWQHAMSLAEYLEKIKAIQTHIINGDFYEMNFCLELFAQDVKINPLEVYLHLNALSPMPFSFLAKHEDHYIICASPERFLKKKGTELVSQPIKGTARRGNNPLEDERIKSILLNDEKEQAENLMIVDLVRNDLSRSSKPGSVKVKELFGIYTFRQVHQMISTVIAEQKEGMHFTEVIKNAFPMGSMTGAPKIKVMELIEHYESSKRGVYSGAAGYITPEGDFDFNVIIRSLLYNSLTNTLSFQVGSAITYDSIPEKEYEECMLKAGAMMKIFNEEY
ncbi:MAG: anthranilate synthase component I family protein [Bacteroidota bacterium]|nr:anthranilate synthase component I family protein [Bacteroidota bacterium]